MDRIDCRYISVNKKTIITVLLSAMFLGSWNPLRAQNVSSDGIRFDLALMGGKMTVADLKYSSLNFSGFMPGILFRLNFRQFQMQQALEFTYSTGDLKTSDAGYTANTDQLTINYFNLFPVLQSANNHFQFQLGSGLEFLYNQRNYSGFINTPGSFESLLSLALTGKLEYHFGASSNALYLSDQFTIPFLYYTTQPSYSGLSGESDGQAANHLTQFGSFSTAYRFMNRVSLVKPLSSSWNITLFYSWDFYHIRSLRDVRTNNQQLALGVCYQLEKNH